MDIASLSMGLANSRTLSDVGTAVLSKTLDMSREQGAAVTEMLASAGPSRSAMEQSVGGGMTTPYAATITAT